MLFVYLFHRVQPTRLTGSQPAQLPDAARFGKNNWSFDKNPFTIVEVKVPNSVMKAATKGSADGLNVVSVAAEHLPKIKNWVALPSIPKPTNLFNLPGW